MLEAVSAEPSAWLTTSPRGGLVCSAIVRSAPAATPPDWSIVRGRRWVGFSWEKGMSVHERQYSMRPFHTDGPGGAQSRVRMGTTLSAFVRGDVRNLQRSSLFRPLVLPYRQVLTGHVRVTARGGGATEYSGELEAAPRQRRRHYRPTGGRPGKGPSPWHPSPKVVDSGMVAGVAPCKRSSITRSRNRSCEL